MRAALFLAAFLLSCFSRAASQAPSEPRIEPRREAYAFAAADASDWRTALDAALWASSGIVAPRERAAVLAAADELRELASDPDIRSRAEAVLSFMHRRLLRAYSERQTRLDELVDTGSFNCVSSAVLYAILASSVGLDVSGVATKDHAFCAVRVGVELIDVETTNVYGFDPGSRKEFHDSFGRTTGFAYVPTRNYRDRTPLTIKELISLILSNRASDLEASGRFDEAVGLAADRWVLLGSSRGVPWEDLIARAVNYGASLAKAGREADALEWASRAIAAFGPHPRWDEFVRSAANNLLVRLIRRGDIPAARAELDRLNPSLSAAASREMNALVSDAELVTAAESATTEDGLAGLLKAAAAARAAAAVPERRIREIEVYASLRRAEALARTSGWAPAAAEIERLIGAVGDDRTLRDALRAYRANRVAELHNGFAALFNSKRYREARDAAAAAAAEFPDDARLNADLLAAERALRESRP